MENVHNALYSDRYNDGEKRCISWQYNMNGDFYTALWKAIMRADNINLAKLCMGFPDDVQAFREFSHGIPGTFMKRAREDGLFDL